MDDAVEVLVDLVDDVDFLVVVLRWDDDLVETDFLVVAVV